MSWDIDLTCHGCKRPVIVEHHEGEGGTYQIGGTNEASLNVTYNYSRFVPFRELDGMSGWDSIEWLRKHIEAQRAGS